MTPAVSLMQAFACLAAVCFCFRHALDTYRSGKKTDSAVFGGLTLVLVLFCFKFIFEWGGAS